VIRLKRLPKGMKKIKKKEFVEELKSSMKKNELAINDEKINYTEWGKLGQKKLTEKIFRW
jgi:hypothetical protein